VYDQEEMANRAGLELFRKSLTDHGLTVTGAAGFARGTKSFAAQIQTIQAAKPDVLCVAAFGADAGLLVRQVREAGLRELPIVGGGGLSTQAFLRDAGEAAEGVIVGMAWSPLDPQPRSKEFVAAYRQRFGSDPDQIAAQAYAGAYVAAASVRQARPPIRRTVRDALAQLGGIETVLGRFSFTVAREPRHPPVIHMVHDGRFVPYL
jgi:branched-chain amino acid transport system substrate-binding protein